MLTVKVTLAFAKSASASVFLRALLIAQVLPSKFRRFS